MEPRTDVVHDPVQTCVVCGGTWLWVTHVRYVAEEGTRNYAEVVTGPNGECARRCFDQGIEAAERYSAAEPRQPKTPTPPTYD